jgi:hypothetical protein
MGKVKVGSTGLPIYLLPYLAEAYIKGIVNMNTTVFKLLSLLLLKQLPQYPYHTLQVTHFFKMHHVLH